jgi:hypothetical protein
MLCTPFAGDFEYISDIPLHKVPRFVYKMGMVAGFSICLRWWQIAHSASNSDLDSHSCTPLKALVAVYFQKSAMADKLAVWALPLVVGSLPLVVGSLSLMQNKCTHWDALFLILFLYTQFCMTGKTMMLVSQLDRRTKVQQERV